MTSTISYPGPGQGVLKPATTYMFGWSSHWCATLSPRHHPHNTHSHAEVTGWHGDGIHSPFNWYAAFCSYETGVLACGNFSDTSSLETKGSIGHVSANAVQECGGLSWCYACYATALQSWWRVQGSSVRGCSIRRTDWYYKGNITINFYRCFQQEVLGESHAGFSWSLLKRFLSNWAKDIWAVSGYCLPPSNWPVLGE